MGYEKIFLNLNKIILLLFSYLCILIYLLYLNLSDTTLADLLDNKTNLSSLFINYGN